MADSHSVPQRELLVDYSDEQLARIPTGSPLRDKLLSDYEVARNATIALYAKLQEWPGYSKEISPAENMLAFFGTELGWGADKVGRLTAGQALAYVTTWLQKADTPRKTLGGDGGGYALAAQNPEVPKWDFLAATDLLMRKVQQQIMQQDPVLSLAPEKAKARKKVARDKTTEARDKWIYEECCKGKALKKIIAALRKKQSWQPITSEQGIQAAAKRFAIRKTLPLPPARNSAR